MDTFIRIINGIFENDVSRFFCILILLYTIFSLVMIRRGVADSHRIKTLTDLTPGVVTSLGILGTFLGIFLGLLDFNQNNLTASVPKLLEGLKIAFGSSIVGLASAIIFRFSRPLLNSDSTAAGSGADDIHSELMIMNSSIKDLLKSTNNNEKVTKSGFEKLNNSLTGDEDGSVTGQIQKLRLSLSDLEKSSSKGFEKLSEVTTRGFEQQIKEFREFAEHMSKAFSEAIIDELKSVIREFNEKISEQFGENFKQLNAAVGRLVDWQETYKNQMDEMKNAFDLALKGVQETEKSIKHIENSSSLIPEHLKKMDEANELLNTNMLSLHEGMSSVVEMREKAEQAFPNISEKIDEIIGSISEAVENQQKATSQTVEAVAGMSLEMSQATEEAGTKISASIEEFTGSISESLAEQKSIQNTLTEEVHDLIGQTKTELNSVVNELSESLKLTVSEQLKVQDELFADVRQSLKASQDTFNASFEEIGKSIENSVSEQRVAQQQLLDALQNSFNETMGNVANTLNESIVKLDEAMQSEIESVVRTMAENLSGLTAQFVDDYAPLLEQSKNLIKVARQAELNE
ncbi:hypothetical protein OAD74_07305 [Alphaproteobacteria bacterium]|nr:hypothetical protein [Alphaproteobacteria bacterium]